MFKRTSDQKGQSMVEVAIALPVLIMILVGILDLGRAFFTFIALTDAAAEGAAYAAIHPSHTTQIRERAADSSNGLVELEVEMVSVDYAELTAGYPITVAVQFEYDLITPFIQAIVPGGTITMRATVAQAIIDVGS